MPDRERSAPVSCGAGAAAVHVGQHAPGRCGPARAGCGTPRRRACSGGSGRARAGRPRRRSRTSAPRARPSRRATPCRCSAPAAATATGSAACGRRRRSRARSSRRTRAARSAGSRRCPSVRRSASRTEPASASPVAQASPAITVGGSGSPIFASIPCTMFTWWTRLPRNPPENAFTASGSALPTAWRTCSASSARPCSIRSRRHVGAAGEILRPEVRAELGVVHEHVDVAQRLGRARAAPRRAARRRGRSGCCRRPARRCRPGRGRRRWRRRPRA